VSQPGAVYTTGSNVAGGNVVYTTGGSGAAYTTGVAGGNTTYTTGGNTTYTTGGNVAYTTGSNANYVSGGKTAAYSTSNAVYDAPVGSHYANEGYYTTEGTGYPAGSNYEYTNYRN
jgi:hypothetical protein